MRKSTDSYLTGTALLQEAYTDLQNVISNSGCSLNATYESIWDELCQDVITSNRESIFEVPFAAGRGRFSIILVFIIIQRVIIFLKQNMEVRIVLLPLYSTNTIKQIHDGI